LVSDFEVETRSLIEYLDLDWQDSLMSFHERSNHVRTPSANQVRMGINSNSVNKHKKYQRLMSVLQ